MDNLKKNYNKYILNNRKNYFAVTASASTDEDDFLNNIAAKICSGVDILQVKNNGMPDGQFLLLAKKIKLLCAEFDVILLIKSRCDIAFLCGADGVHLEQDNIDIYCAREILGENAIIGLSIHNDEQVQAAIKDGADYILAYFNIDKNCGICCFRTGSPIEKLS